MGSRSSLMLQAKSIANTSGSAATRGDRMTHLTRFAEMLNEKFQLKNFDQVKMKHIETYIQERSAQVGVGTCQNEMSAIRHAMREVGKYSMLAEERLSNKSLGISGRDRTGTHVYSQDRYQAALEAARERDVGYAAVLQLERELGLRAEEAVRAAESVQRWERLIDQARDDERVKINVVLGTKGGKEREVFVHSAEAKDAIREAAEIVRERGVLIDKPSLREAMDYIHNEARAVGLEGEHSMHSLRYGYAQEALRSYADAGYSEREALARVSLELGHGDGRGRYIRSVYAQVGD